MASAVDAQPAGETLAPPVAPSAAAAASADASESEAARVPRECVVCYTDTLTGIECTDPFCADVLCHDCLGTYLEHVKAGGNAPTCCAMGCRGAYRYSATRRITDPIHQRCYEEIVFALYTRQGTDAVRRDAEAHQLLEQVRQEREAFLRRDFPVAIVRCAELVYPGRMRKVRGDVAKRTQEATRNARRICMNLSCNGHMDATLRCLTCNTKFCPRCERRQGPDHQCRAEDVQSVEAMRQMIHCPSCQLPIQRSLGCRNMTCANCGTKFDYHTGEIGGQGSHNTMVQLQESLSLGDTLRDVVSDPTLLRRVLDLEAMRPVAYKKDVAIQARLAKHYLQLGIDPKDPNAIPASLPFHQGLAHDLCRIFERDAVNTSRMRLYFHITGEVEELAQTHALSCERMDVMLRRLRDLRFA